MFPIYYEDNHIIVIEKPVNVPVQADASGDLNIAAMLKGYIKEKYDKPGEVFLGIVHRLDRPVGGVMVFARTSKAAARLSDQFASRTAKKRYAAVVEGETKTEGKLEGYLVRDERTGTSRLASAEEAHAKRAALRFSRAGESDGLSLLDIDLYTGRHHQIRVQLAGNGTPIWGDQRYNRGAKVGQQIALWAYSLTFSHPVRGESMSFLSIPADSVWRRFEPALKGLGMDADVLYADEHILVVNKRAGISVADADSEGDHPTLEAQLRARYGIAYPVHRLDVATSGLILFARTSEAQAELDAAIRVRSIRKFYRCVVLGRPREPEAMLRGYLKKDARLAQVQVFDEPREGAKEILTGYRVVKGTDEASLLEVELITGRTHQIRAHLAHIGCPILGDDRYGNRAENRRKKMDGLMLCAVRLTLEFPAEGVLSYLSGRTFAIGAPFDATV